MRHRDVFAALLLSLFAGSAVAHASATHSISSSCPADPKLAQLIAGSSLIVIGRMDIAKQRLVEEAQKSAPDYLEIPIRIDGVVKGGDFGNATLRFFPKDAPSQPSNTALLRLADAPAIFFLTRIDEGRAGLYFAGDSPESLKPATEQTIGAARAEAARQMEIIRSWRADASLPRFSEVRALIARLGRVSGEEQQGVFQRLEALGNDAVPALIAQMDDRRPLLTRAISLVNHAQDAFERMRQYGPEQVVDGLDAVLNQITGFGFGSIVNGGSNLQRDATVAGWRVYAADLGCKKQP